MTGILSRSGMRTGLWVYVGMLILLPALVGQNAGQSLSVGNLGLIPFLMTTLALQMSAYSETVLLALPVSRWTLFWSWLGRSVGILALPPLVWGVAAWSRMAATTHFGPIDGLPALAWGYAAFAAAAAPALWIALLVGRSLPAWTWNYFLQVLMFIGLLFAPWTLLGEWLSHLGPYSVWAALALTTVAAVSWAATALRFLRGDWVR